MSDLTGKKVRLHNPIFFGHRHHNMYTMKFHETGDLILFALFVLHKALNWQWIRAVTAGIFRRKVKVNVRWVVDALQVNKKTRSRAKYRSAPPKPQFQALPLRPHNCRSAPHRWPLATAVCMMSITPSKPFDLDGVIDISDIEISENIMLFPCDFRNTNIFAIFKTKNLFIFNLRVILPLEAYEHETSSSGCKQL